MCIRCRICIWSRGGGGGWIPVEVRIERPVDYESVRAERSLELIWLDVLIYPDNTMEGDPV
jgi:hypothetical protein